MIHSGKNFAKLFVTEDMVGHKLGEFAPTRMFKGHSGGRAKDVRRNASWLSARGIPRGAVSADDLVDAVAGERDVATGAEHRLRRRRHRSAFGEELTEMVDRLVPQRA